MSRKFDYFLKLFIILIIIISIFKAISLENELESKKIEIKELKALINRKDEGKF